MVLMIIALYLLLLLLLLLFYGNMTHMVSTVMWKCTAHSRIRANSETLHKLCVAVHLSVT